MDKVYIRGEAIEERTVKGTVFVKVRITGREDIWVPKTEIEEQK